MDICILDIKNPKRILNITKVFFSVFKKEYFRSKSQHFPECYRTYFRQKITNLVLEDAVFCTLMKNNTQKFAGKIHRGVH